MPSIQRANRRIQSRAATNGANAASARTESDHARTSLRKIGFHPPVLCAFPGAAYCRSVLELVYRAGGRAESTRREVEPLGLIYYGDHWHLIAFCRLRQDFRDFRTDRVTALTVRPATFAPRAGFSVRDYVNSWCGEHQGLRVTVRFRTARALERARRSWFAGLMEEQPARHGAEVTFPTGELDWTAGWLLSFGTEVEVLAPADLRVRMAERAAALAEHHAGETSLATAGGRAEKVS